MHPILETLARVMKRVNEGSLGERKQASRELAEALAALHALPRPERHALLAEAMEAGETARRAAADAAARYDDRQVLITFVEASVGSNGRRPASASRAGEPLRYAAMDTKAAIVALMREEPTRSWRPIEMKQALVAARGHATKSMVESALPRLVRQTVLTKDRRGRYRLADFPAERGR